MAIYKNPQILPQSSKWLPVWYLQSQMSLYKKLFAHSLNKNMLPGVEYVIQFLSEEEILQDYFQIFVRAVIYWSCFCLFSETPWLMYPGLSLLGIGGLPLLVTNTQVWHSIYSGCKLLNSCHKEFRIQEMWHWNLNQLLIEQKGHDVLYKTEQKGHYVLYKTEDKFCQVIKVVSSILCVCFLVFFCFFISECVFGPFFLLVKFLKKSNKLANSENQACDML